MCLKSNFKEIVLKLATNGQSDKAFLLTSTFVLNGLSPPALGLYTCIKALQYIPGLGDHWSSGLMFFRMYISPGAGADNPLWTKSWCQQKSLVTLPICCKFKKNIFEVLILYIIFHIFIYVSSPGAGATIPWGQKFYININFLSFWSFAVSFFH